MNAIGVVDCPMPEPFREKIGITVFLAWLFYLGFVARVLFAPLMPDIEADLGITHSQAGSLFLSVSIGYLGETYSFSIGIVATGIFMATTPVLICFLKLGQYDDQAGC